MCQGNAQASQGLIKEEQGFTRLRHVPHSGRKGRTVLNRRKRRQATNRGKMRVSIAAIAVRILTLERVQEKCSSTGSRKLEQRAPKVSKRYSVFYDETIRLVGVTASHPVLIISICLILCLAYCFPKEANVLHCDLGVDALQISCDAREQADGSPSKSVCVKEAGVNITSAVVRALGTYCVRRRIGVFHLLSCACFVGGTQIPHV
jgi:hypothetical protein